MRDHRVSLNFPVEGADSSAVVSIAVWKPRKEALMSQRPFRFLHAADLRLDQPCYGLTGAPEHLVELLIDCPLQAATRLFDAAIDLRVSFLVLSGEVIDPERASPRELNFFVEQLNRLADRSIAVYWAGNEVVAAHRWPTYVSLPANVKLIHRGNALVHIHEGGSGPFCKIVAASANNTALFEGPRLTADRLFSIALADASWTHLLAEMLGVSYWAFAGSHERKSQQDSHFHAYCPGTHQGRSPSEQGAHGVTLVTVDEEQHAKLRAIDTDVVRFQNIAIALPPAGNTEELEKLLHERIEKLREESASRCVIVDWKIECHGKLRTALRQESLSGDLATKLNGQYGHTTPAIWTNSISSEMPEQPPQEWRDDKTLRSDFLKAVRQSQDNLSDAADLLFYATEVPDDCRNRLTQEDLFPRSSAERRRVLQDATWLGAELLSPAEARP
jgi:DNA repair protein SbcD/Mre11